MPDFTDLISQAQKMQEKMRETQENLKKIELNEFYKIAIVSLFLLSLKSFMIIVLLLPLILFYLCKKKLFLADAYLQFFLINFYVKYFAGSL